MAVRPDVAAIRRLTALARREKPRWFTRPVTLLLLLIPVLLVLGVDVEHMPGVLLAYVNLVLIGLATVRFVRCRTLPALVPVMFLVLASLSFPTTSIYCAVFQPQATYGTLQHTRYVLEGNLRVQSVVFVFLLCYLAITSAAVTTSARPYVLRVDLPITHRLTVITFWFATAAHTFHAISKLVELPALWQYLADGFIIYLRGLFFILGATFVNLRASTRIVGGITMLAIMAFYTLGNRREYAVWPVVLFVLGLLFFGRIKQRTKLAIVAGVLLLLPVFIVLANTTRELMGSIGFENLEKRVAALSQWREQALTGSIPGRALGRLFSTGGHSLITLTPERYSYLDCTVQSYMTELLTRLLPGALYYRPYVSTTGRLERYDFLITEETSVEMSMLGNLWMVGGYLPVILGGVGVGILHVILMRVLAGAGRRSSFKAIFYFSLVVPVIMMGHHTDVISHFRAVVWKTLFAVLLYHLFIAHLEGREQPTPLPGADTGRSSPPGRS